MRAGKKIINDSVEVNFIFTVSLFYAFRSAIDTANMALI